MVWIYSNILSTFPIHGGATHFGCFKWIAHASPSFCIFTKNAVELGSFDRNVKKKTLTNLRHYYNFGSLENTWTLNVIHRLRYMWNQMINLVIDRPFYNFLFFFAIGFGSKNMIMRLLCQLPMQNIWIFDKIVDGFKIKCLQPWTIRSNKNWVLKYWFNFFLISRIFLL